MKPAITEMKMIAFETLLKWCEVWALSLSALLINRSPIK